MATHLSGRFSPPPRRNSPSNSNPQAYNSHSKFPPPPPPPHRDRYRDRSLPPRRYPQYENELNDHDVANRQSLPPPSQRANLKSTSPFIVNSNSIHREQRTASETMKPNTSTNTNVIGGINGSEDLKKRQEEIFKYMLEAITDVSSLKVESKKAMMLFEASKEKYERTICHHSRFPNLKITLQNELDRARESVDKINEELSRRDMTFRELAGESLPILLPTIQAYGSERNQKIEDPKIIEKLERVVSKSEQQYTELQQELGRFKEEQRKYQIAKDRQLTSQEIQLKEIRSIQLEKDKKIASQEIQFREIRSAQIEKDKQLASQELQIKEIRSSQLEKDNEIIKLRSQLRTLNEEVSSLKIEKINAQSELETIKNIANNTQNERFRVGAYTTETEVKNQEKLKNLEAQVSSLASVKSGFKILRENGLFDLKLSTVEEISTTLNRAVKRVDSLPSAASYFSLNSRLENVETKMIAESTINEISNILGMDIENRLKFLEAEAATNQVTQASSYMSISVAEEKFDTLSKQVLAISNSSKVEEELLNLRTLTGELQRSLNIVRINVAGLHERTQSAAAQAFDDTKIERVVETKTRKLFSETFRKITEVSQSLATTNHSLENLMARVDNVTTGHLAQAILSQLSELYPNIQNADQLISTQGKLLRELQTKVDQLSEVKADSSATNQSNFPMGNNGRNLGNEVDKISEDIFKTNQSIKKLATAIEEERKFTSEMLDSRLDSLVSNGDLEICKTQIDSNIQNQIEKGVEEHTKNIVLSQLGKAPNLLDTESFDKLRTEIEASIAISEKNAATLPKIEEKIGTLREELTAWIMKEIQEQKGGLEELVSSHVDRSLDIKQPDFIKEVTRHIELKESNSSGNAHKSPNPVPSTSTNSQKTSSQSVSNSSNQRSKRKLHDIKAENSHKKSSPSSSTRFVANKKNRHNSSGTNDTP